MSRFSDKEGQLVQFLRQYRPSPPAAPLDLELRLLTRIQVTPQERRQRSPFWRWSIPGALILAALAVWTGGQQRWQFAIQPRTNTAEIEAFMVENWQATVNDPSLATPAARSSVEWVTLTDAENRF